jgi:SAM-dependent methyltransferase
VSTFLCNICGRSSATPDPGTDPEKPTCSHCGSNQRTRALLRLLSLELFGTAVPVPAFPRVKSLCGIGTSDSGAYVKLLEEKFDYHNTFFHREPRLDIANPPEDQFGKYDFILSSEVLEHVPPPAETAFHNLYRLLKPNGVLVFTVPYSLEATTAEHFPELHEFGITPLGEGHVLVNRTRDGQVQVFENLVFHGGQGATLEMRQFSECGLKNLLAGAGFQHVRIDAQGDPDFGVVFRQTWSLPIVARKGEFALSRAATGEIVDQWHWLMRSSLVRLGRILRLL